MFWKVLRERRSTIVIGIITVTILVLYAYLNTRGTFRFVLWGSHLNYNMLAQSILNGHFHLLEGVQGPIGEKNSTTDPTELSNQFLDGTVYKGKYFLRHDPFPVVFHTIWMGITGRRLSEGLVIVVAAFGCVVVLFALLKSLEAAMSPASNRMQPEESHASRNSTTAGSERDKSTSIFTPPDWLKWYFVGGFALCGAQLFMISRPIIYHESIVVAGLATLLGAYFFLRHIQSHGNTVLLTISGTCFGCAFMARSLTVLYFGLFGALLLSLWIRRKGVLRTLVKECCAFGGPGLATVVALGMYNYARFDNFFDSGLYRVIWPDCPYVDYCLVQHHFFRIAHVPQNFATYFTTFPAWKIVDFMPVFTVRAYDIANRDVLTYAEHMVPLFMAAPFTVLSIPGAVAAYRENISTDVALFLGTVFFAAVVMLLTLLAYYYTAPRYFYDFTPFLFVCAYANVFLIWKRYGSIDRFRRPALLALGILFAVNVYLGLIYGLNGMVQTW